MPFVQVAKDKKAFTLSPSDKPCMHHELQYRIELCPCRGASGDTVGLLVWEEAGHER